MTIEWEVMKDHRNYNKRMINYTIESNKTMKVLRKTFPNGQKRIHRIKDRDEKLITNITDIPKVMEKFYAEWYESRISNKEDPEKQYKISILRKFLR